MLTKKFFITNCDETLSCHINLVSLFVQKQNAAHDREVNAEIEFQGLTEDQGTLEPLQVDCQANEVHGGVVEEEAGGLCHLKYLARIMMGQANLQVD